MNNTINYRCENCGLTVEGGYNMCLDGQAVQYDTTPHDRYLREKGLLSDCPKYPSPKVDSWGGKDHFWKVDEENIHPSQLLVIESVKGLSNKELYEATFENTYPDEYDGSTSEWKSFVWSVHREELDRRLEEWLQK